MMPLFLSKQKIYAVLKRNFDMVKSQIHCKHLKLLLIHCIKFYRSEKVKATMVSQ